MYLFLKNNNNKIRNQHILQIEPELVLVQKKNIVIYESKWHSIIKKLWVSCNCLFIAMYPHEHT